ncbi:hypothetical protein PR002_g30867 [Phytophthora rubi]|uniref:Uncharacterized protein n=1 Tax=Phytophthora rubi TaxID=129364 RepID=A0A6A3GNT8_9STRA|nr:hypothetical protein PR002_g30867 [Phytophthora rubi]
MVVIGAVSSLGAQFSMRAALALQPLVNPADWKVGDPGGDPAGDWGGDLVELGCGKRFSGGRIVSGPGLASGPTQWPVATIYEFLAKKSPSAQPATCSWR